MKIHTPILTSCLLLCGAGLLTGQVEEPPPLKMLANPAESDIVIDGTREADYRFESQLLRIPEGRPDVEAPNFAALWSATYDADNLYLFFDFTDDIRITDSPDKPWHDDGIELFIDGDNSRSGEHDGVNDFKWVIAPHEDGTITVVDETGFPPPPAGADFSGVEIVTAMSEGAYTLEMKIPLALIGVTHPQGWVLGFDVIANDDDDGGNKENILRWSSVGNPNNNTTIYGSLELAGPLTVLTHRTDEAITIDGEADGAYGEVQPGKLLDRTHRPADSAEDLSASFQTLFDDDNLYVFIDVMDDAVVADSDGQPWQDDSVELYIDGDNSDSGEFDGVNDFKWTLAPQADGSLLILDVDSFPAPPAGADFSGVEAAHAVTETGYAIEVKIPLDLIGVMPMPGWQFGLDFWINDDDDGDNKEHILAWSATNGLNNASQRMGTAELKGNPELLIEETAAEIAVDGLREAAWDDMAGDVIDRSDAGRDTPPANNLRSSFSVAANGEMLYLFIDVFDPVRIEDDLDPFRPWRDDSVELYIDGDNSDSGEHDGVNDFKFIFAPRMDGSLVVIDTDAFPPPPAGADFSGMESAWSPTAGGYALEIGIPYALLGLTGAPGSEFGLDFGVRDDDDGGGPDNIITWSAAGAQNNQTQKYGTVTFIGENTTLVAEAESAIVADGLMDEGYAVATAVPIDRPRRFNENPPAPNDLSGVFYGLYDADNLYLLIDVIDPVRVEDDLEPFRPWRDDSIELYIDGDNNKGGEHDGVNDFKFIFAPRMDGSLVVIDTDAFPLPPAGADFSNMETAWSPTPTGFMVETKIPLDLLGIDPVGGWQFGLDIWLRDDDNGGGPDNFVNWAGPGSGNNATNLYGTATLDGDPPAATFIELVSAEANGSGYVSPWFGAFETSTDDWIQHGELGWTYVGLVEAADSMWLYSFLLESWLWTNEDIFGVVYDSAGSRWIFYFIVEGEGAWLYDYGVGTWVMVP